MLYAAATGTWFGKSAIPPDFVLEIASETTHSVDTGTKSGIYAGMGAAEYWRFDSIGGEFYGYALAGDILVNGVYQPTPLNSESNGEVWGYSPALDLSLCALSQEEGSRLRFYDHKTERYLPNLWEEQAAHRETQAELERLRGEPLPARPVTNQILTLHCYLASLAAFRFSRSPQ